jgi:hypothetical protein
MPDARLLPLLALLWAAPARAALAPEPSKTFTVEAAHLFDGAGGPLIGEGDYVTVDGARAGSGRWFDWRYEGRASVLGARTRWFDGVPPPDPLLREPSLRGDPAAMSREDLYFLGVMGRVGRAYPLWGPLDFAWNLQGIARADQYFPTATLDQSLGLRARLGGGHQAFLFGGVTEGVAALSKDWAAKALAGRSVADPHLTRAPHLELGVQGPLSSGRDYQAFAGVQDNELTRQTRLEAALSRPGLGGTVSAGLRAENEDGRGVEFSDHRRALRLSLTRRDGWEWSVETGRQALDYGGATSDGRYVMFGLTVHEKDAGRSAGVGAMSGSTRASEPKLPWDGLQGDVTAQAAALQTVLDLIPPVLQHPVDPAGAARRLSDAYAALPQNLRDSIETELGGTPDFPQIVQVLQSQQPTALADVRQARKDLRALQDALSDPHRLERIFKRWLDVEAYASLSSVRFRLFGKEVPLTPGLLVAAVHAYGQGQGLIAPVPRDAGTVAEGYLYQELQKRYASSCPSGDVLTCAISGLPPELQSRLQGVDDQEARRIVAEALGLAGQGLRLEVNRYLLSVYASAKALDPLTIERGDTPGVIARRGMQDSFARLDERRRPKDDGVLRAAFRAGARRLERETERDDAARAAELSARAARLSGELSAAGLKADPDALPALVSQYGEESLRLFALQAGRRLQARGTPLLATLTFNPDPVMGLSVTKKENGALVLSLPPASGRDSGRVLGLLLQSL